MTLVELIESVAKRTKLPKSDVGRVIKTSLKEVITTVKQNESVKIKGFGKFFPVNIVPRSLFGGTRNSHKRISVRFRESRENISGQIRGTV